MNLPIMRAMVAVGGMSVFYVVVLSSLGGGVDFPIQQFKVFWMYLVPLVLSYGGLMFVSSIVKQRGTMMIGTPTSAASMVACCAHHVADLVPLASVFSASSILVRYQAWMMIGAIGVNVVLILRLAIRLKRPGLAISQGQAL